jgi:hypothetical protein
VVNGTYRPEKCKARHKVAILIPYRDRATHLRLFLNHMHAFLMKQQLEYGIYVVELVGLPNLYTNNLYHNILILVFTIRYMEYVTNTIFLTICPENCCITPETVVSPDGNRYITYQKQLYHPTV